MSLTVSIFGILGLANNTASDPAKRLDIIGYLAKSLPDGICNARFTSEVAERGF